MILQWNFFFSMQRVLLLTERNKLDFRLDSYINNTPAQIKQRTITASTSSTQPVAHYHHIYIILSLLENINQFGYGTQVQSKDFSYNACSVKDAVVSLHKQSIR